MVRIYFTLDGTEVLITDAQFECDAKEELELAWADGNHTARLLRETDGTEDYMAVYEQLTQELEGR